MSFRKRMVLVALLSSIELGMLIILIRLLGAEPITFAFMFAWLVSNLIRNTLTKTKFSTREDMQKMKLVINHVMQTTDPDEIARKFQGDMVKARQRYEQ